MSAKIVFAVGLLGVGGYVGHKVSSHDPSIVDMPKAEVEALLAASESRVPRKDGDGLIRIWGAGASGEGIALRMRYAPDAPLLECRAVVTAVGPDKSRVAPDCGRGGGGDAIERTTDALRAPMFAEHIAATIGKRPFNRTNADRQQIGIVLGAGSGLQDAAMRRAEEFRRMEVEAAD